MSTPRRAAKTQRSATTAPPAKKKQKHSSDSNFPEMFQCASLVAAVARSTQQVSGTLDVAHILEPARQILLTEDGASWVYYVPKWYQHIYAHCNTSDHADKEPQHRLSYEDWFDAMWDSHPLECGTIKLFGKEIRTPRYQQAYGVTHRFSGATFDAKPFPELLEHAVSIVQRMLVDPESGATHLKAGLVNWYKDGDHYMGPHSDDGANIERGSPVFSLTLGQASRRFVLTPRVRKGVIEGGRRTVELTLGDGDLLIMGGSTQQTHKHALPKMKRCTDRRVNVTLRYLK